MIRSLLFLFAMMLALPTLARPLVIAHRGASGELPEHTLAAYERAIDQGADFIEPDLVMTRDGVLIARHEPLLARVELEADGKTVRRDAQGQPVLHRTDTSTNVWQLPQFADRLTVKRVDGQPMAGWFAEDFTAAELRAHVRAQERLRDLRTANNAFNDQYVIPTLAEVIELARSRGVGIYPETKHPSYFLAFSQAQGVPRMEDGLLAALHAAWGNSPEAPVFIQSFEVGNLQYLRPRTRLRLVQLLGPQGGPFDLGQAGDSRNYADLATPDGLDFIKGYADAIGPHTRLILPPTGNGIASQPTKLVAEARQRGLAVHAWTFRAENAFLPLAFRRGTQPGAAGDLAGYLQRFVQAGVDGVFADQPGAARAALGP